MTKKYPCEEYELKALPIQLYPVLLDEDGQVIDGNHRLAQDPKWKKTTVQGIKGEKLHLLAEIAANSQRRRVKRTERASQFRTLAGMVQKEGFTPGKICLEVARLTGFTSTYVSRYMPAKYKDPAMSRTQASPQRFIYLPSGRKVFMQSGKVTFLEDQALKNGTAKAAIIEALINYWKTHPDIIDLSKLKHYGYKKTHPKRYANGEIIK